MDGGIDGGEGRVGGGRGRGMLKRNEVTRFALASEILQTTKMASAAPAKQQISFLISMLFLKCQSLGKGQTTAASLYIHRTQRKDWFLHTVSPSQKLTSPILEKHTYQPC